MANNRIKTIFGAASFTKQPKEAQQEQIDILHKYGVKSLDTAHLYPGSEENLGEWGAAKQFTIDTKAPGFYPGSLAKEKVLAAAKQSFELLKTDQVDTYFLHSPDVETPITESLEAIQEIYKQGRFKRFGLSNFSPEQVQEVYDICKAKGYPLPTVFQGNYNPLSRHIESDLFPVLRKLGISFNAYSPLAGGFLARSPDTILNGEGRFDPTSFVGQLYNALYNRPALVESLNEWAKISEDSGVSKAALAYRWVAFHSALKKQYGDAIIIGASRASQLEETLKALEAGPLEGSVVKRIEAIWATVKHDAPLNNVEGAAILTERAKAAQ